VQDRGKGGGLIGVTKTRNHDRDGGRDFLGPKLVDCQRLRSSTRTAEGGMSHS
jgi:hypothetical protein